MLKSTLRNFLRIGEDDSPGQRTLPLFVFGVLILLCFRPAFTQEMQAKMVQDDLVQSDLVQSDLIFMKGILENSSWTVAERVEAEGGIGQRVQEPRVYFGRWSSREERSRFVRVVIAMVGTPYVLGGSSASGMDCSHFVQSMYELFDVPLPRTTRRLFLVGVVVEKKHSLEEGDLVFFDGIGKPSHVGIFIGGRMYAHASSSAKMVRIDSIEYPWNNLHYVGAVRVRELEN